MAFSVSPHVSVKEVDLTAVIPASQTDPAALAGVFNWGPIGERTLVTSEDDLVARFGEPSSNNYETWFVAADFLAYSNAMYVTRIDNDANTASSSDGNFTALYAGAKGNDLGVSYTDANGYSTTITNVATGNVAINDSTFTIVSLDDEFLSTDGGTANVEYDLQENDILRVGSDTVGFQNLVVNSISVVVDTQVVANTNTDVYTYTITFKNRYTLAEESFAELDLERIWGFSSVVEGAPLANTIHLVVYDKTGNITGTPLTPLEVYSSVSTTDGAKLADGTNNYYVDILENQSAYIAGNSSVTLDAYNYETFSGGSDGTSESAVSIGALAAGYDLYKDPADVDISFVLQGKANAATLANYIVANIAEHRKDCIAVLSPKRADVVGITNTNTQTANVRAYRAALQSSSYFFLDSGYKYRYDKYNDVYRWVPLNGDMGGLMARVDPWVSPAGYKRGIIRNVVRLAYNPTKPQRDLLYGDGINPVITQTGQGTLLFGDKTGQGFASAFDRINVRRLFITVEKNIATVSHQFLFDFNDEFTQTQFKNLVDPYLRDIQGKRGIIDFRVVSDETVNTPDIVDQNTFRANIFIKPARTINFIELTFVATRSGVDFEELVGQQF